MRKLRELGLRSSPPRRSTACTKVAWRSWVHLSLGIFDLTYGLTPDDLLLLFSNVGCFIDEGEFSEKWSNLFILLKDEEMELWGRRIKGEYLLGSLLSCFVYFCRLFYNKGFFLWVHLEEFNLSLLDFDYEIEKKIIHGTTVTQVVYMFNLALIIGWK